MSQNKSYSDFLKMMAALVGIPPNRITTELEAMWRVLFNNAIADIWERGPFLEISPYGEARFVDNHLDYPNNQKASAWVPTGVELTRNAVVNPLDWRINATEMLETSDVSEHKVVQTVDKWIPGVQYEASFYARYKGRPLISLEVWDGVEEYYGTFNILTGAVAAYSSTVTATIQQVANNFYFCKIQFTTDAEASTTGTYTIRLSGEDTNQFIFETDSDDILVTDDGDTLVTDCETTCLYWNTEQTCEVDVCTPAPSNLIAPVLSINVDQADDTMELSWVNGESDYDNLYLERSTDGTNFSALATLAGNDTAHDDTDVLLAVQYYYRIRGIVDGEYTAYSNIVDGTLTIAAPVLSLTVDDENDQMDLSWTNGEPDYTALYLERSLDGSSFSALITLAGNDTAHVDSDVEGEITYYYRIRGLVDGSYSAYSNIVSGTLGPGISMSYSRTSSTKDCTLIGYSELVTPSTPPKKYLVCTFDGVISGTVYNVSGAFPTYGCFDPGSGVHGFFTDAYAGVAQYNAATGAFSTTALETVNQTPGADGTVVLNGPVSFDPSCYGTPVITNTLALDEQNTGDCCLSAVDDLGFPTLKQIHTGFREYELSVEDTEENAIARATPTVGALTVAAYQARSSFDFVYRTIAILCACSGLTMGVDYLITIPIVTADYGGANPVSSNLTYPFTASGPTEDVSDTIIAARGKQITVGDAVLSIA